MGLKASLLQRRDDRACDGGRKERREGDGGGGVCILEVGSIHLRRKKEKTERLIALKLQVYEFRDFLLLWHKGVPARKNTLMSGSCTPKSDTKADVWGEERQRALTQMRSCLFLIASLSFTTQIRCSPD